MTASTHAKEPLTFIWRRQRPATSLRESRRDGLQSVDSGLGSSSPLLAWVARGDHLLSPPPARSVIFGLWLLDNEVVPKDGTRMFDYISRGRNEEQVNYVVLQKQNLVA